MIKRLRWAGVLTPVLVLAIASAALAVVSYGNEVAIPSDYAFNYSNSLDYTGTPGGGTFKLHNAFVDDWNDPAVIEYTNSSNGTSWSGTAVVSGAQSAEGSSLATAGTAVIVGWFTGYSWYDADGVPRVTQVNVSKDSGATWGGVKNLSSSSGHVDYPIVAAAKVGATTNVYAAWVDSDTCKVKFRQSSNYGKNWSSPVTLGKTTATQSGAAYGCSGFANIAAVDDLISVVWISSNTGTMKVRSIDLNGNASAATSAANWNSTTTLSDKISTSQNGYPIASASPQNTGVVTIAYNTNAAQKYTTFTGGAGSSASAAGTTVYTNAAPYAGGYSTVVEPAPGGGFVAMWAGCRDTGLKNPCNYGSAKAKFDLLESSSADGTTWSTPQVLEAGGKGQQLNDEASMVVIPDGAGVKVYAQYNEYNSRYSYYDVWMKIGTGPLGP